MNRIVRFLPLILIELFIGMTYWFYRCGAWMYPYRKDNLTLFFMLGCLFMFALGYLWKDRRREKLSKFSFSFVSLSKYLMILDAFLLIPYSLCRTGEYFPPLISAFSDLSIAYANATKAAGAYGFLHTIVGFGTILIYYLYHMTYYYWEELSPRIKVIALLECLWFIAVDLCTGRNKGITVICIMLVVMYFTKLCDEEYRKQRKNVIIRSIVTIIIILMVPLYFSKSLGDRGNNTVAELESSGESVKETVLGDEEHYEMIVDQYGYQDIEVVDDMESELEDDTNSIYDEYDVNVIPGRISKKIIQRYEENAAIVTDVHPYYADEFSYSYLNLEDPIYKFLPGGLKYLYAIGTNYVGHGYHALTIALRLPFDTCFGFGHASVLQGAFKNITGIDIYKNTYVYKLNQSGYPVSLKWGTAFIQWASDISFIGVVILMGFLGGLTARLWHEVLIQKNMIALLLLTALAMNLLFITSWWQAGMSGTDFVWFYGAFFVWILQKIITKYIKINKQSI